MENPILFSKNICCCIFLCSIVAFKADVSVSTYYYEKNRNEDKGPASMGQLKFTLDVDIFMYGKSDTKCESRELNTIEYIP